MNLSMFMNNGNTLIDQRTSIVLGLIVRKT
jgi:hypothetical protein